MKVGVLQFFSWSRRVPLTAVYERAFSRIAIMDQTGYDCVWLAEHHFNTYSVCPSINVMATHVAARTRNLRIGMAVSLAAFYNPLRLAEEVALIDVLSGGRVNWGAGRGFDRVGVRGLRRAGGGELRPLPGVRGDRPGGVAATSACQLSGPLLELRRHRGAAQAAAGAAPAGVAGGHVTGFDQARRREGLRHPAGPARHTHGYRPQAGALLRRAARARVPHRGPRDPHRALARGGRHRSGGRRRGPRGGVVDGGLLRQSRPNGPVRRPRTGFRGSIRWSAT